MRPAIENAPLPFSLRVPAGARRATRRGGWAALAALALAFTAVDALAQPTASPPEASITPPRLVDFRSAEYPDAARAQHLEASVLLSLDISERGHVLSAKVVEPAGHGFDEAALQAARQFHFLPAARGGSSIAVRIQYRYEFTLEPAVTTETEEAGPSGARERAPGFGRPQAPPPAAPPAAEPHAPSERSASNVGAQAPVSVEAGGAPIPTPDLTAPAASDAGLLFEGETTIASPPREPTRRSIDARVVTRIPGTRGDALRAVEILPGVSRNDASGEGEPILRGASSFESASMLDGVPIPILYHFGNVTSTYSSRLLKQVDVYPGNFSVRYGRVLGGIVNAVPRDPNRDRLHGVLDLSILDSSALLEAPVSETTSFAIAGRRSNLDFFFEQFVPDGAFDVVAAPLYWDYEGVVRQELGRDNTLRLLAFGSHDSLELLVGEAVQEDPALRGQFAFSIEFHQFQAQLQSRLDGRVRQDLSAAYTRSHLYQAVGPSIFGEFYQHDVDSRAEWSIDLGPTFQLVAGFDGRYTHFTGAYRGSRPPQLEGDPNINEPTTSAARVAIEASFELYKPAGYAEASWSPTEALTLMPGLRYDYFSQLNASTLDPRLAARYQLAEQTVVKSGVGLFSQEPQYFETVAGIGNPHLDPARALHTSLGVEQGFGEDVEAGLEGFFKHITDRVVATEGGVAPYFINDGSGRAFGLEVSGQWRPTGRSFAYLAYTLMRSERRDRAQGWRLFDYDQTHNATVAGGYDLGAGWDIGARLRLVSGNPETPVDGSVYDATSGVYVPYYGATNSSRTPLFHQLDLLVQKRWRLGGGSLAAYLDLQNAYAAEHREGTEYSYDYSQSRAVTGVPLLPNLGVRGEL